MAAAVYNITIEKGATFSKLLRVKNDDSTPVDLTGYVAEMQIRKRSNPNSIQKTLSTANGKILITPLLGRIFINLSAEETLLLENGIYDLEITSDNDVKKLLRGKVSVTYEVSR